MVKVIDGGQALVHKETEILGSDVTSMDNEVIV
jgi:hypothetical protein